MSQTTTPSERDNQPTTPHEVVEKHGRQRLEKLADQGNITAQAVLEIVDEPDEGDRDA